MRILGAPITWPAEVALRVLRDAGAVARAARDVGIRLDALDERAAGVQAQLDRALELGERIDARGAEIVALGERILEVGERMDEHGTRLVESGERLEQRGDHLAGLAERLLELGALAVERAEVVAARAELVAERGAEVAAALPTLERAVALAQPLEGAVERLGRMVDRLPGGGRVRGP